MLPGIWPANRNFPHVLLALQAEAAIRPKIFAPHCVLALSLAGRPFHHTHALPT